VQSAFIDVVQAQADVQLARESLAAFNGIVTINTERVRSGDLATVELERSRLAPCISRTMSEPRDPPRRRVSPAARPARRTDTTPIQAGGELRREVRRRDRMR